MLEATATGRLDEAEVRFGTGAACCVVMASEGYPDAPKSGRVIEGLREAEQDPLVRVIHAGTKREGDQVVTAGGRVLGVTANGADLMQARLAAYAACDKISFEGAQLRRDIGQLATAGN